MPTEPFDIRPVLASLLSRAEADARLTGELQRTRREFFAAGSLHHGIDDPRNEAAAQRFTEWFLLERPSEALGEVPPIQVFRHLEGGDEYRILENSRLGLFLVEARGKGEDAALVFARDLDGGDRLPISAEESDLGSGDVLAGRLFVGPGEQLFPSTAAIVMRKAIQVAIAFQKDLKQLALGRRMSQQELEHLVHQSGGATAGSETDDTPVEHLEAELQTLFDGASVDEVLQSTFISDALREVDSPGSIIDPLMDQLAFDTEVDLDRTKELLLRIWNAHQVQQTRDAEKAETESEPPSVAPQRSEARDEESTESPAPQSFKQSAEESLGESLARRIEEGLARGENVEALFQDVERLFGEEIPDDEPVDTVEEDGDVLPLIREFAWEMEADKSDVEALEGLAKTGMDAPVPCVHVESLTSAVILRHGVTLWLQSAPPMRATVLQDFHQAMARFVKWLRETQEIELESSLEEVASGFLSEAERLREAESALRSFMPSLPAGLHRVVGVDESRFGVVSVEDGEQEARMLPDQSHEFLRDGDHILRPAERGDELFSVLPRAASDVLGG